MKQMLVLPDVAYAVREEAFRVADVCGICDGTGDVWLKGKQFICPQCNGSGGKATYMKRWGVCGPMHFVSATVSAEEEMECTYKYMTSVLYGNHEWIRAQVRRKDLFATEEEARRAADARNAAEERNLRVAEVI